MQQSGWVLYMALFIIFNLSIWYFAVDSMPSIVSIQNSTPQSMMTTSNQSLSNHEYWKNDSFNSSLYIKQLYHDLQIEGQTIDTFDNNISEICRKLMTTEVSGTGPKDPGIWSQAYQDWFMFHQFFYGKQDGIYVEIGANHPFLLSNSAFFDICMGWKGICVEPSLKLSKVFENKRSCTMVNKCGWSMTQNNLKMLLNGGGTSIISEDEYRKQTLANNTENLFSCDTISGFDLLTQYQPKNKFGEMIDLNIVRDIDFISLDIEGAEEEFLKCFPFNKYNVKVWVIEINKGRTEKIIDRILYHYGYIKLSYLPLWGYDLDAVYVISDHIKPPYINPDIWGKYSKCDVNISLS